jgi:hypothetical protein
LTQWRKWEKELNTVFSKEEVQMTKKPHEGMLNISGIKEIQIKTTEDSTSLLTPVRMTTIKNTNNNKCW